MFVTVPGWGVVLIAFGFTESTALTAF